MPAGTKPAASGGGGIRSKYMHSVAILGSSLSHGLHTCFLPPPLCCPRFPGGVRFAPWSPPPTHNHVWETTMRGTRTQNKGNLGGRGGGGEGFRASPPSRPPPPRPPLRNAATTIQATSTAPHGGGWGLTQNCPVRGPAPCVGHCADLVEKHVVVDIAA